MTNASGVTFAPSFRASDPCLSRATGNFKLKSRAWALTSESLKSGSTQTPIHFTFSAGKLSARLLSVGL